MVAEGKTFVDAGEAAAWYEEKVRRNRRIPRAALIVQRGRLWEVGRL